jgi:predicted nuclease of predicted toxin-antitoxin system
VKALIDQNLSFRLVDVLLPRFPGSCHVRDVGLAGVDDELVWRFAKDEGFSIVRQ